MSKATRVWTVLSMLEWATEYFEQKKIPDPRLSIEWIIAEALGIKRLDLYLQYDRPLSSEELDTIRPLVKRRAAFEPLQYITGTTSFINTTIRVTPDVLIPRIETEQLVDILLQHYADREGEPLSLLDIGTGSGCIPIAIKKENPGWSCTGTDISDAALNVARENAQLNETEITFFRADINNLTSHNQLRSAVFDVIISNPPYIQNSEKNEMNDQVLQYEPHLALFHDSPLTLYQKIIEFAHSKRADLFLECNDKTAHSVQEYASQIYGHSELKNDLDSNPRFVVAEAGVNE